MSAWWLLIIPFIAALLCVIGIIVCGEVIRRTENDE